LGGEAVWSEVRPGLWIGRRPLGGEIPEAARLVIDLTCEFGELPAAIGDRRYVNLPTLDAGTPDAAQFRAAVREALGCEGGVYVHCALGHGRSALFVAALLMARGDADSVEDAEARIRAVRPAVRLNGLQRRFVERWTAESE
jgi:protein-tyrosine phosphatase